MGVLRIGGGSTQWGTRVCHRKICLRFESDSADEGLPLLAMNLDGLAMPDVNGSVSHFVCQDFRLASTKGKETRPNLNGSRVPSVSRHRGLQSEVGSNLDFSSQVWQLPSASPRVDHAPKPSGSMWPCGFYKVRGKYDHIEPTSAVPKDNLLPGLQFADYTRLG